ncbi:MAG: hypothetical protein ACKOE5_07180 [Cytophagales bacterium]
MIVFLMCVAIGCTDNLQPFEKDGFSLSDGRLKFNNYQSFTNFLNANKTNDQLDIEKINRVTKQHGFVSHREHLNLEKREVSPKIQSQARLGFPDQISQYLTAEEDSIRLSAITDPQLASLINEKQEIQFGEDSVYRVQNDYTFRFHLADTALIIDYYKALKQGTAQKPADIVPVDFGRLKVYKTLVKVISLASGENQTGGRKEARRDAMCSLGYAPDTKMEGKLYSTWAFFYSSGAIETKVIRRIRRCNWFWCSTTSDNPQPATRLAMNFDIYVSFNGAVARRFTESISRENSPLNNFSLGSLGGWNVARFDFSGWSCHSTTFAGTTLTCSNQFYDNPLLPYTSLVCP